MSIVGAFIILLTLFLTSGVSENRTQKTANLSSQLLDVNNSPVNFSDLKGKVVFVNNWASWCPPCVAEMSSIQNFKNELNDKEFVFIMVSYDEDHDKAISFMKRKGFNFDFDVYFPGDKYPYATESIPATFILDRYGKLVEKHFGMRDYSKKEIVDLMKSVAVHHQTIP